MLIAIALWSSGGALLLSISPPTAPEATRLILLAILSITALRSLSRFERCHAGVTAVRIYPSGAARICRNEQWTDAQMTGGSMVLSRLAWIRLRLTDGGLCEFLHSGNAACDSQWRRFLVISRHIGGHI